MLRVHKIIKNSYVDGPGCRVVLQVCGCTIRCPGCQNKALWDPDGGTLRDVADLADDLVATGLPITVTGGEPFDQAEALLQLLWQIRDRTPDVHIIVYSGRIFPEQVAMKCGMGILAEIDVLVDGPYVIEQDSDAMQFMGSANQRAIDMRATLVQRSAGEVMTGFVVLLDWGTPLLSITDEGNLVGAVTVVEQFAGEGVLQTERRCGQA